MSTQLPSFENIPQEIANMLDVPDDMLTEEQRAMMDSYLDELGHQEAEKVDGFAQFIRIQTGVTEACKKEDKRLAEKAKTAESRIGWLKNKYLTIMQINGLKKVTGSAYTLYIRENESVVVEDMAALEKEPLFVRTKTIIEPDKGTIKEAIKAGQTVPGCELRKSLSLQIR